MKKVVLFSAVLAGLAVISCKKEDPKEVNVTSTAVVTGLVTANLDYTNDIYDLDTLGAITNANGDTIGWDLDTLGVDPVLEAVENVRVFAKINAADLHNFVDPNFDYADRIVEAVTDEEGRFTLRVPAGSKTVSVEIYGEEFEFEKKITSTRTERTIYTVGNQTTTVTRNQSRIIDLEYTY